jgi:hypothetical protein
MMYHMSTYQDEQTLIERTGVVTVGELIEALSKIDPATEVDLIVDVPEIDWSVPGGLLRSVGSYKAVLNEVMTNPYGNAVNLAHTYKRL